MALKCANFVVNGCNKGSYYGIGGICCRDCALSDYGVRETMRHSLKKSKRTTKMLYTEYLDPVDKTIKTFEYINGQPVIPFCLLSDVVVPEKLLAEREKVFTRRKNWLREKHVAKKAGKPPPPPIDRRSANTSRSYNYSACVKPGCDNVVHNNTGGITCGQCALEEYATPHPEFPLSMVLIYNPRTNEYEEISSECYTTNCGIPFDCLAHGYVNVYNYESKKMQWRKRQLDNNERCRKMTQERINTVQLDLPTQEPMTSEEKKQAEEMMDEFVGSMHADSLFCISKGRVDLNDMDLQVNDEAVAHMISRWRAPLLLVPTNDGFGRCLKKSDFQDGGILPIRSLHTAVGREQLALQGEADAQNKHHDDPRRLWQVRAAGERTGKRDGDFSFCAVEYEHALSKVRNRDIVFRDDMPKKQKDFYLQNHEWLRSENGGDKFFLPPNFDHHKRKKEAWIAYSNRKKAMAGNDGVALSVTSVNEAAIGDNQDENVEPSRLVNDRKLPAKTDFKRNGGSDHDGGEKKKLKKLQQSNLFSFFNNNKKN